MNNFTVSDFVNSKKQNKKISMLTAYDYPTAKIFDDAGIDSILVGDSLGMVVLGYEDTTKVTMEDMLHHSKAVTRATKRALVIGDMPFLSYHLGKHESVKNAGRFIQEAGCGAVKLEGGLAVVEDIKAILNAGIPVMGHLGYTPQSINLFGGHKAQGKSYQNAKKIIENAILLQEAGVFSIVLECIPYKLAKIITNRLEIPTISIGAGPFCDGQVIVSTDLLGLQNDVVKKHCKRYEELGLKIELATKKYITEINEGIFPTIKNSFIIDDEIITMLEKEF